MHLIKKCGVKCDNEFVYNQNLDSHENNYIPIINEQVNAKTLDDLKDSIVNKFEDITVLDDDGQLKSVKVKSAAQKLKVQNDSDSDSSSDKVSNQLETPVQATDDEQSKTLGDPLKLMEELGCKYRLLYL